MAVTSIQNVGGFKGGETGYLEAQRKPPEREERARKSCSTQPARSNTLRKSSYKLSEPGTATLKNLNSVNYTEIASVLITVEFILPAKMAAIVHAIPFPSPHTFQHHSPPQTIFQNLMKGSLMPTEQSLETSKSLLAANSLRSEMSAIVSDMEKLHVKTARAIRTAAKSYQSLIENEKSIFRIGDDAADWPEDVFRYRKPGQASRHFAICCFAAEFQLVSQSLLNAPNLKRCQEASTFEGAFKSFKYLRDSWEQPERFVEVAPENIEYVAATEADFGEDV